MLNKFELLRIIESENRYESRDKFAKKMLRSIRVFVHFFLFLNVLTAALTSKITLLYIINEIVYYDYVSKLFIFLKVFKDFIIHK